MPGEDPQPLTQANTESDYIASVAGNAAAMFTEQAITQCMKFDPELASKMANACNGRSSWSAFEQNNSCEQYLPAFDEEFFDSASMETNNSLSATEGEINWGNPEGVSSNVSTIESGSDTYVYLDSDTEISVDADSNINDLTKLSKNTSTETSSDSPGTPTNPTARLNTTGIDRKSTAPSETGTSTVVPSDGTSSNLAVRLDTAGIDRESTIPSDTVVSPTYLPDTATSQQARDGLNATSLDRDKSEVIVSNPPSTTATQTRDALDTTNLDRDLSKKSEIIASTSSPASSPISKPEVVASNPPGTTAQARSNLDTANLDRDLSKKSEIIASTSSPASSPISKPEVVASNPPGTTAQARSNLDTANLDRDLSKKSEIIASTSSPASSPISKPEVVASNPPGTTAQARSNLDTANLDRDLSKKSEIIASTSSPASSPISKPEVVASNPPGTTAQARSNLDTANLDRDLSKKSEITASTSSPASSPPSKPEVVAPNPPSTTAQTRANLDTANLDRDLSKKSEITASTSSPASSPPSKPIVHPDTTGLDRDFPKNYETVASNSSPSSGNTSQQDRSLAREQKNSPDLVVAQSGVQANSNASEALARNQATTAKPASSVESADVVPSRDNSKLTGPSSVNTSIVGTDATQSSKQPAIAENDAAGQNRQLVAERGAGADVGARAGTIVGAATDTTQNTRSAAVGVAGADVTSPLADRPSSSVNATSPLPDRTSASADVTSSLNARQLVTQAEDAASPNAAAGNALSANQMIDAMQRNVALSRDSSSALMSTSSSLLANAFGYPPSMQIVDASGKAIADSIGTLRIKESGAVYNPSTINSATANLTAVNAGAPNLANSNGSQQQSIKEGQMVASPTTSQGIVQALQGLLQQGQGAPTAKLDETGKAIVKGSGTAALTDALAIGQSGKKGTSSQTEGVGSVGIGIPFIVTTKGGSIIDGATETKLPIAQNGNVTNTGIIITATAGATTTGQTGAAGTTANGTATTGAAGANSTGTGGAGTTTIGTGAPGSIATGIGTTGTNAAGTGTNTAGTTGTTANTTPGTHDPNATDIKSLVTALPTVQIIDSKKGDKEDDEGTERPEIDYDSVESNDLDDDDDYIDTPVIEVRRSASNTVASAPKKPANIGLSIIENIMVLINDLKNQKVDNLTARRMWADLFTDLFGKQKRQLCTVRADDTLENIARFVLKDARLAPLLYTINVHAKTIKPLKNNESDEQIGSIKPQTKQILLPHRSEILRYKIHVLKETSALVLYAQSNKITNRDFSAYICRTGDTLKSIAASHIDLRDESLWADIALHNGLSVRVDKAGNPIVKLKEGQLLQIPKIAGQDEREDDEELTASPVKNMSLVSPIANLDINSKDEEMVNKALAAMEKRIITQSDLGSGKDSVLIKLELKDGNNRMNVAEWDVNATASSLKLYDRYGSCKIIPIALSTRAARELAENDLRVNADRYCKMFLTGDLAA